MTRRVLAEYLGQIRTGTDLDGTCSPRQTTLARAWSDRAGRPDSTSGHEHCCRATRDPPRPRRLDPDRPAGRAHRSLHEGRATRVRRPRRLPRASRHDPPGGPGPELPPLHAVQPALGSTRRRCRRRGRGASQTGSRWCRTACNGGRGPTNLTDWLRSQLEPLWTTLAARMQLTGISMDEESLGAVVARMPSWLNGGAPLPLAPTLRLELTRQVEGEDQTSTAWAQLRFQVVDREVRADEPTAAPGNAPDETRVWFDGRWSSTWASESLRARTPSSAFDPASGLDRTAHTSTTVRLPGSVGIPAGLTGFPQHDLRALAPGAPVLGEPERDHRPGGAEAEAARRRGSEHGRPEPCTAARRGAHDGRGAEVLCPGTGRRRGTHRLPTGRTKPPGWPTTGRCPVTGSPTPSWCCMRPTRPPIAVRSEGGDAVRAALADAFSPRRVAAADAGHERMAHRGQQRLDRCRAATHVLPGAAGHHPRPGNTQR